MAQKLARLRLWHHARRGPGITWKVWDTVTGTAKRTLDIKTVRSFVAACLQDGQKWSAVNQSRCWLALVEKTYTGTNAVAGDEHFGAAMRGYFAVATERNFSCTRPLTWGRLQVALESKQLTGTTAAMIVIVDLFLLKWHLDDLCIEEEGFRPLPGQV